MRFFAAAVALCLLLTNTAQATDSNSSASASARTVLPNDFRPPRDFKNVNLLRNINLEKGYIREQINVVIENIADRPQTEYYLPFSADVTAKVGGLEVWNKNDAKKQKFETEATEYLPSRYISPKYARFSDNLPWIQFRTTKDFADMIIVQFKPISCHPSSQTARAVLSAYPEHKLLPPLRSRTSPCRDRAGCQTVPQLYILRLCPLSIYDR